MYKTITSVGRRISPRLLNKSRPFYGSRNPSPLDVEDDDDNDNDKDNDYDYKDEKEGVEDIDDDSDGQEEDIVPVKEEENKYSSSHFKEEENKCSYSHQKRARYNNVVVDFVDRARIDEEFALFSKHYFFEVNFNLEKPPKPFPELHGLVCDDISGGKENLPIPATNIVDNPPFAPTGFIYSKTVNVSERVKLPINAPGCTCKGYCRDPNACACARLNGCDFPYVRKDGGRLVEAKDVVFECGPNCGCGPGCVNRISQNFLMYRLEVFRTPNKGWAVRSWDFIPSGAPVCEYTGILRRTDELDNDLDNIFIFEIDCLQTMKGLDGRERRQGGGSLHPDALEKINDKRLDSVPEFCIDAGSFGNVSRFINHSCEPNLFVQCILSSHHDIKLAQIMLFAADDISPLQELTYDYGYALDSVMGPDGTIKKMPCYCGTADCRKRLY